MSLWTVTETSYTIIEAPTREEAARLFREYPLNRERQEAVKRFKPQELRVEEAHCPEVTRGER